MKSTIKSDDPNRDRLNTDDDDPKLEKWRKETDEPGWTKSKIDVEGLNRAYVRSDSDYPKCTRSITDNLHTEPTVLSPQIDGKESSRLKDLVGSGDPKEP